LQWTRTWTRSDSSHTKALIAHRQCKHRADNVPLTSFPRYKHLSAQLRQEDVPAYTCKVMRHTALHGSNSNLAEGNSQNCQLDYSNDLINPL